MYEVVSTFNLLYSPRQHELDPNLDQLLLILDKWLMFLDLIKIDQRGLVRILSQNIGLNPLFSRQK